MVTKAKKKLIKHTLNFKKQLRITIQYNIEHFLQKYPCKKSHLSIKLKTQTLP